MCVYVFVQKIYIHSMSCSLTIALDARDSNKMSMNVLGTYLQIFFAYTQNSISTKTKEEKKIAQGHTHLPILAKFFYLMPSHFFFVGSDTICLIVCVFAFFGDRFCFCFSFDYLLFNFYTIASTSLSTYT